MERLDRNEKAEGRRSTISEALGEEHKAILRMMEVLKKVSSQLDSNKEVNAADLEKINEFLTRFLDKCRHGKEERALFPAMKNEGGDQQLIKDLLQEHIQGRRGVRRMVEAAHEMEVGGRGNYSAASKEYTDLLIKHIEKENNIAFPMADELLSDEQKSKLMEQFEEIEEKVIGLDEHHRLLRNLEELEKKYA